MEHLDVTLSMGSCDGGRDRHAGWQVQHRHGLHLGVDERLAVRHGAGERVPALVDVRDDLRVLCVRGGAQVICLGGQVAGRRQNGGEEYDAEMERSVHRIPCRDFILPIASDAQFTAKGCWICAL